MADASDEGVGHEARDHKLWIQAGDKLSKEIEPLKTEIEQLVQARLGYKLDTPG